MGLATKTVQVSTHSRLKAAGRGAATLWSIWRSFNTQPPEGGWAHIGIITSKGKLFQHTAA